MDSNWKSITSNTWKLNNTLQSNSKRKSQRKPENTLNWLKTEIYWSLWDIAKAVLTGNFIALTAHFRREERLQTNILSLHFKSLKKKKRARKAKQIKPKKKQKEGDNKNRSRNQWNWKQKNNKENQRGEFLVSLGVRILGLHCHGLLSIPGRGTEILQAVLHSWKKEKKENSLFKRSIKTDKPLVSLTKKKEREVMDY